MKNTVAIIGSHPRSRTAFDFSRTDCDVWVFNEALSNGTFQRADATFQMHDPVIWKNPGNRNDSGYSEWIKRNDIPPVWMLENYPEVPQAIKYPLDSVLGMINNFNLPRFVTSSPAYGIALAIYLEYKRIEIYGVEMESQTEYMNQRAGIAFWVGVAVGKGIEVWTNSKIFEEPLYGYEGRITIEYDDFINRIEELKPIVEEYDKKYQSVKRETSALLEDIAMHGTEPKRMESMAQVLTADCANYGYYKGQLEENERYARKIEQMKEAANGYLIVRQEYEQAAAANAKAHNASIQKTMLISKEMDTLWDNTIISKNAINRRVRMRKFVEKLNELLKLSVEVGIYHGRMDENTRYMEKLDHFIRAAGGSKSEAVMKEVLG